MANPNRPFGPCNWGESNIRIRRGCCEFCGRWGDLRSYDTRRFFNVLLVPLVPLGKKRALCECPACRRSRIVPLGAFRSGPHRDVEAALDAFRRSPADENAARRALDTSIAFESEQPFLEAAGMPERGLPGNARLAAIVGSGCAFFERTREAEASYIRSLRIEADPDVQEALAVLYLKLSRPDDAGKLISPILQLRRKEKLRLAYAAVGAFQNDGRHYEALALLEEAADAFPAIEFDPKYLNYRAASEAAATSTKGVTTPEFAELWSQPRPSAPPPRLGRRFVIPALVLLVLGIYLAVAYSEGSSRWVFVVNGTHHAYDVTVAGKTLTLKPMSHTRVQVPEGEVAVVPSDDELGIKPQTCRIATPFFTRPFLNRTFVLNPDGAALVVQEEAEYVPNGSSKTGDPNTAPPHLFAGDLLYSFDGMDYEFDPFPTSIEMDSSTSRMTKKRVGLYDRELTAEETLFVVEKEVGPEKLKQYIRNRAMTDPDNPEFVQIYLRMLDPHKALEEARPMLAKRPVLIEWHRFYQDAVGRLEPDHDLRAEYKGYLDQGPTDPGLMYLLGRASPDRKEAREMFLRSTQGPKPFAYGFYALAYDDMCLGDFKAALDHAVNAVQLKPDAEAFKNQVESARLANRDYDTLIAAVRKEADAAPEDGGLVAREIDLLAMAGRFDEAEQAKSAYVGRMIKVPQAKAQLPAWQASADAAVKYIKGDLAGYAERTAAAPTSAENRFAIDLSTGKLDEAAAELRKDTSASANSHLLLYLAYATSPSFPAGAAESQLTAAAKDLADGDRDERRIAAWLTAPTPPDPEQFCAVIALPDEKRLLLAAMGLRDPAHAARYFKEAARFNYDTNFPYWTVRQVIEKRAKKLDGSP
jgi:hypothetical protein